MFFVFFFKNKKVIRASQDNIKILGKGLITYLRKGLITSITCVHIKNTMN